MSLYQSRLLRFLNRHSLRFRDRIGQTARQIKVAAEWGVQMLIYPVYLLVQTGRLAGQTLGKNVDSQALPPSSDPNSHSIPVDQPIERILSLVNPWLTLNLTSVSATPTLEQRSDQIQERVQMALPDRKLSLDSPLPWVDQVASKLKQVIGGNSSPKLAIQGVASTLDDHQLVLVTTQNEPLNLLSEEQQKNLEKRIKAELANFYYEKRLYNLIGRHFPSLIPQFTEKNQQVSPPIRWFWQTMRWVQTSDVAIALNLFGESSLVRLSTAKPTLKPNPDFPQGEWGEKEVINSKTVNKLNLSQLNALIQSAIDYFYGGLRQSSLANSPIVQSLPEASLLIQQKLQKTAEYSQEKWLKPANFKLKKLSKHIYQKTEEPDPFRLQAIVEAAIAHFFTRTSPSNVKGNHPYPNQLSSSELEDPWLTPEDLFPVILEAKTVEESPTLSLPQSAPLPNFPQSLKPISSPQAIQSVTPQPKAMLKNQSQSTVLLESSTIEKNQVSSSWLKPENSTSQNIEFSADWMETEVKAIGYVKHPLEQLLNGLDKVILWLEEIIVKLWRQVQKLLS